jgi:GT2 family glycosyltransferase
MTRILNITTSLFHTLLRAGKREQIQKAIQLLRSEGLGGFVHKLISILNIDSKSCGYGISHQSYQQWLKHESFDSVKYQNDLAEKVSQLQYQPLISVILPTYNTNPTWLRQTLDSVLNQIYQTWELCVADDASSLRDVRDILNEYAARDPRIKLIFRQENGHISEASNSAITLATGSFLALLDHDDTLAPDALLWVAKAIHQHPNAAIIYSDEDKLDRKGARTEPYFKCDWNHTLFLQQNMINHLGVYRTVLVNAMGGFRKGFEGAQDYDLALRVSEQCTPAQIIHIPRVLYHWRIHNKSTSSNINTKSYAAVAARRAVEEHMHRTSVEASVTETEGIYHRIQYTLPDPLPMVSIIIPTKNNHRLLQRCISGLRGTIQNSNFEILIIDNGSSDHQTLQQLHELNNTKQIKVIADARPFNFSALNNHAVQKAQGEYLLFLNDDTEAIHKGWFEEMLSVATRPDTGAVGARLLFPDKSLQHAGVILGLGGVAGHSHKYLKPGQPDYFGRSMLMQEISAVTGACMMLRKKVFQEAGGFDETNLAVAFNDVDLCLKIRTLGYKVIYNPYAELMHYESYSRGNDLEQKHLDRFMKENKYMLAKWKKWIDNDPAYSPNLTRIAENFSIADRS